MKYHDFGDDKGLVEAKRHRNPDGTKGGMVAKTASVSPDIFLSREAKVTGSVRLIGKGYVMGAVTILNDGADAEEGVEVNVDADYMGHMGYFSDPGWYKQIPAIPSDSVPVCADANCQNPDCHPPDEESQCPCGDPTCPGPG